MISGWAFDYPQVPPGCSAAEFAACWSQCSEGSRSDSLWLMLLCLVGLPVQTLRALGKRGRLPPGKLQLVFYFNSFIALWVHPAWSDNRSVKHEVPHKAREWLCFVPICICISREMYSGGAAGCLGKEQVCECSLRSWKFLSFKSKYCCCIWHWVLYHNVRGLTAILARVWAFFVKFGSRLSSHQWMQLWQCMWVCKETRVHKEDWAPGT